MNPVQQAREYDQQKKAEEERRRAAAPPGWIQGPGATQESPTLGMSVTGDEGYTAGLPGYHGELSEEDKQNAGAARNQQNNFAGDLRRRAMGLGGPSAAELQMQRGMNVAQQRLRNQAVSGRGMNRAGAQRAAMRGASDMYMQGNEQAGIMRAQEQLAAQQLYSQHLRDMRQQDLLSRGYGVQEANAILDAEMRAQGLNAQLAEGAAGRRQGVAIAGIGALAGLASDRRAKEVMYSDFTGKEPLTTQNAMLNTPPVQTPMAQPAPAAPSGYGFQPMLQVAPEEKLDDSVTEQQRTLGDETLKGMSGSNDQSLAQNASAGFNIGSALGGLLSDRRAKEVMPSDFRGKELGKAHVASGSVLDLSPGRIDRMGRFEVEDAQRRFRDRKSRSEAADLWRYRHESAGAFDRRFPEDSTMSSDFYGKEPTMADLDQVGNDAMLPFRQMDAAESRQALAPVEPVVYRYKPADSARMAGEQADMADLRARYAGLGGAAPEEEQAIEQGTFQDKRTPRLGIIAQDLQKSPEFRQSVVSTPAGLAVQRDRALSTALGSLAGIDKRLRQLEDMGDSYSAEIRGESPDVERARRLFKEKGGTNQRPKGQGEAARLVSRYGAQKRAAQLIERYGR